MLKAVKYLIAPVILGALAAPAISNAAGEPKLTERQQAKLDAMLKGRVAGEPQACIQRVDKADMTTISDGVFVFASSRNAKTIYVNKPAYGCHGAKTDALVTRPFSTSYCRGEIVQVVDLQNGVHRGSCAWGDFIPYTKAGK